MNKAGNNKLYFYSSLFIALILNVPKLFALRKSSVMAAYWHFNITELAIQTLLNFLFCICIFYYCSKRFAVLFKKHSWGRQALFIMGNIAITAAFTYVGITIQKTYFAGGLLYGGGVFLRLFCSIILIFIELRIVSLLEATKQKEIENEHLRNAYLLSELEVLKGQLNPHFFFNALTGLSAIVREDPPQAQLYISHLSKVFRHTLQSNGSTLSNIKEEVTAARSYAALMKMRHEDGFVIDFTIDEKYNQRLLPAMSLQPLIENALKHNSISAARPLQIIVSIEEDELVVTNNIRTLQSPVTSSGIGLTHLNERYRILMKKEISILSSKDTFTVKLPLK